MKFIKDLLGITNLENRVTKLSKTVIEFETTVKNQDKVIFNHTEEIKTLSSKLSSLRRETRNNSRRVTAVQKRIGIHSDSDSTTDSEKTKKKSQKKSQNN